MTDPMGTLRCVACQICEKECPPQCIYIEKSKDKKPDVADAGDDFLLGGDVFTPDLIETWIQLKRENEIDPLRLRPHPYEFALYYDV